MEENKTSLTRREALKALAAAGGALTAAAFLPGKWARPLVETGVLPAHAQGSCPVVTIVEVIPNLCTTPPFDTCPGGARWALYCRWTGAASIPGGATVTVGGAAVENFTNALGDGNGYLYFDLPATHTGWTTVVSISFGNCLSEPYSFTWPN